MADRAGGAGALRYDPGAHAAEDYPEWVIRHRELSHGIPEVMCRRRKVILIANHQDWPGRRCSLAHAVAHLDLGHTELSRGTFDRDHEADAKDLAARRLISVEHLAEVLCWTRFRTEIAAELEVDLGTLDIRQKQMRVGERRWLKTNVRWLEETA